MGDFRQSFTILNVILFTRIILPSRIFRFQAPNNSECFPVSSISQHINYILPTLNMSYPICCCYNRFLWQKFPVKFLNFVSDGIPDIRLPRSRVIRCSRQVLGGRRGHCGSRRSAAYIALHCGTLFTMNEHAAVLGSSSFISAEHYCPRQNSVPRVGKC